MRNSARREAFAWNKVEQAPEIDGVRLTKPYDGFLPLR
jgi:hypothetical protein